MRKIYLVFLIMLILAPTAAFAGIHGIIKGKVVDQDGNPVVSATVRVLGTTRGAKTNLDGKYTITNVVANEYEVKVSYVGYQDQTKKIRVSADQTITVNFELSTGDVQLQEVVIEDRKMVDDTQQGTIRTMTQEDMASVPRESIQAQVGMSAGVSTSGGGFQIRGSRSSESQIRVDGLDVGNQFTGGFGAGGSGYFPMTSQFAASEVQVITGNFSAEYGNALGGVVNTVMNTGRTDRYEGMLRWKTDLPELYGYQDSGIELFQEGQTLQYREAGEGMQSVGQNDHKIDVNVGGPIPGLTNSTFFLSGNYNFEQYRGASFDVRDPAGNSLSQLPNNHTWVRNITGRMKFYLNQNINLVVGGMVGVTSWENMSRAWLYSTDEGVFFETQPDGSVMETYNGMPERAYYQPVGNQKVYQYFAKINHTLSANSFYELKISWISNGDEATKRLNMNDPDFFSGFEMREPTDSVAFETGSMIAANNKIIDQYEYITKLDMSSDGYFPMDVPQINPLTGYIEGSAYSLATNNPWGGQGYSYKHGNSSGFSYRAVNYWQIDGSYTNVFDVNEFSHYFKTGFELRLSELDRYYVSNPWSGNPFYDVYTDEWGGNIFAVTKDVREETSEPFTPMSAAFYIQDQIKYKGITVSPGLRFDFLEPNSQYRALRGVYLPISADSGFADAEAKVQISPRLNITYPVTDMSNISISYGQFFKAPDYQYMYDGYTKDRDLRGNAIIGDPNMDAQRSNQYQVNYEQQLTDDMAVKLSVYYKDVFNQLGIQYVQANPPFYQYSVSEYSSSKGVELNIEKRLRDNFGFRFNYTLAKAVGTATGVGSNYAPSQDPYTGKLSYPLTEYPLGNDVTHSMNLVTTFAWAKDQGPSIGGIAFLENTLINFTNVFSSGSPYTRTDISGKPISDLNSLRGPSYWRTDMKISRRIPLADIFGESMGNTSFEIFFDVFNLLNRTVPVGLYTATSDPDDNGGSLNIRVGNFSSVVLYKDVSIAVPETFSSGQYDLYGDRLYAAPGDHDGDGSITQTEKYQTRIEWLEDIMQFRGNYQSPRTVFFGVMFRF